MVTRMLKRAALVIIDMQPIFDASQAPWVIENVRREIRVAKRRKEPIILVRYRFSKRSLGGLSDEIDARLLCTIGKYPHVYHVEKRKVDGSDEIIKAIEKHNLNKKYLKIAGVNTDACVAWTVNELSRKMQLSTIIILSDACHSCSATRDYSGRNKITRRHNVQRANIQFRARRVVRAKP